MCTHGPHVHHGSTTYDQRFWAVCGWLQARTQSTRAGWRARRKASVGSRRGNRRPRAAGLGGEHPCGLRADSSARLAGVPGSRAQRLTVRGGKGEKRGCFQNIEYRIYARTCGKGGGDTPHVVHTHTPLRRCCSRRGAQTRVSAAIRCLHPPTLPTPPPPRHSPRAPAHRPTVRFRVRHVLNGTSARAPP